MKTFDFDYWANLHKTDPERFELERMGALSEEIERLCQDPEKRQRLHAMVWRQQQELSKYKNDTARFNKVVELFWQQFVKFQEGLDKLKDIEKL